MQGRQHVKGVIQVKYGFGCIEQLVESLHFIHQCQAFSLQLGIVSFSWS